MPLRTLRELWLRTRARPALWRPPSAFDRVTDFFDRRQLSLFYGWTQRMSHFDPQLRRRLAERRIQGIRAWEYGSLLSLLAARPESAGWSVLDVGPGNSAMPFFLAGQVRRVTTLDYARALEPMSRENRERYRAQGVQFVFGNMLSLPYPAATFDLVTCISAIEHLDDLGEGRQLPYEEFLARTRTGLREMARVVRPGGYLFVTTDACIDELQLIDKWSKKRQPGNLRWSIYRTADVQPNFLDTIRECGFDLLSTGDFDDRALREDSNRSTYRGRYCTTFVIFARKQPNARS